MFIDCAKKKLHAACGGPGRLKKLMRMTGGETVGECLEGHSMKLNKRSELICCMRAHFICTKILIFLKHFRQTLTFQTTSTAQTNFIF